MVINFEECRKKWLRADEDLVSCKEVLAKAETERGALEVKLKHARNQVDVEIRRRQKAEAVHEKLVSAKQHISLFFFFFPTCGSQYVLFTNGTASVSLGTPGPTDS